ncbi:MAG: nucleotidyltransferase family protein [Clostridia bacterium]|nr:nucleotidyltransferase family protein [Clostridia bacterium]
MTQVGITLGYLPDKIQETFGDGSAFNMQINYFLESEPLGTAGGVKNAENFLDEDFVVISGDAFTDIDLGALIDFHYLHNGVVTIAATEVDNPSNFGVMIMDDSGLVTDFVEKPSQPVSNLVNMGIYVMDKTILRDIPKGFQDFAKNIFPNMLGSIYAMKTKCYWSDIGTLTSYYATNYFVASNIKQYETV